MGEDRFNTLMLLCEQKDIELQTRTKYLEKNREI